jgi:hypothetical protein
MWNSPIHLLMIGILVVILFGGRNFRPRRPPNHPVPADDSAHTNRPRKRRTKFWHASDNF